MTTSMITIPRSTYRELVAFKQKMTPSYKPTKSELTILKKGRKNFQTSEYVFWSKLKNELDRYHRPSRRKTA